MNCLVCMATWPEGKGKRCPQCGYDHGAPNFQDPQAIHRARSAFRDGTTAYAPDKRVRLKDKLVPWAALVLGAALLIFWLKACASMGWSF